MITLSIKIPPYLKSYLENTYGTSYKISSTDELGVMIISMLRKKDSNQKRTPQKTKGLVDYNICMSMSFFEKEGCHIYDEYRLLIAKTIDKWFRNNLFRAAVINHGAFGIPYKETINKFLEKYNIPEEELSYSTIRKDFNRKKEAIETLFN